MEGQNNHKRQQIIVFGATYIAFFSCVLLRKTLSYAAPSLGKDVGIDLITVGTMTSVYSLARAITKVGAGFVADNYSPRYLLAITVFSAGFANLLFSTSSSVALFTTFWLVNGICQGMIWAPIAKLLSNWCTKEERGTWWALISTGQNTGGFVMSLLGGATASKFGWQATFLLPGVWTMFSSLIAFFGISNSPNEVVVNSTNNNNNDANKTPTKAPKTSTNSVPATPSVGLTSSTNAENSADNLTFSQVFNQHLLKNFRLWLLCFASLFHDIARTGWADWGFLILVKQKELDVFIAGSCMLWFEVGGFLGGIAAGRISDQTFKGRRDITNMIFSGAAVVGTLLFWQYPGSTYVVICALVFVIGFAVQGPQNLLGLASSESTHKRASGTALGLLGAFAAVGASLSGNPLSQLTLHFGLSGFCLALAGSSVLACVCLVLLLVLFPERVEKKED